MAIKIVALPESIQLKDFQRDMIRKACDFRKKYLICAAARQTGKSFALRIIILKWLIENENTVVGYFSLTNKMCKYFFGLVSKIIPDELQAHINASELTITLTNGSVLRFYTLEPTAVGNIRGTTLDFAVIDEAAFMAKKTPDGQLIWEEIISPMLDVKCKKVIFVSTPHGKQGVFYEYAIKCYAQSRHFDFIKNTIYDDETKTEEWIEAKRAEMSDNSFRQEYCCEFLDEGASFFTRYVERFKPNVALHGAVVAGIDWSSVGPDNTILTVMDMDGNTKQYLIEGSFDNKYRQIGSILDTYSNVRAIYAEKNSIGAVMINELKKATKWRSVIKEFNTTNTSKNDIINSLARDIEQGDLTFDIENELLKNELSTYSYVISNNGNVIFNGLAGTHDDTVMSLAICNYGRHMNRSAGTSKFMVGGMMKQNRRR